MSVVTYHLRPWRTHTFVLKACMVEQSRAWHAIIALGKHARFEYVGRGMHHGSCVAHTVRRRRAWHAILTLDKIYGPTTSGVEFHHIPWTAHTVGRRRVWHAIIALGQHTQGKATSGVACHHRSWTAYTVRQPKALHIIFSLGLHIRSDDIGPRNAIIALCQNTRSDVVGH